MSFVQAPVPDLLIRIKNGIAARKSHVRGVQYSNLKSNVLDLLKKYGFIKNFRVVEEGSKKTLEVELKPVVNPINDKLYVKIMSTPSRPRYIASKKIKTVAGGRGIGILSTSKGLMPAHEAKKQNIGGLLIAEIY
jgi:small subunit ribosomal protein S8